MPEYENIKMRISSHPKLDKNNNIVIDVLQDGYIICNIIVKAKTGQVTYYF